MIDYDNWKAQPLSGPRLTNIVPAIEQTIKSRSADLETVISGNSTEGISSQSELDTTFVRLLTDYKKGRIASTLDRADIHSAGPQRIQLVQILASADSVVTLPAEVLSISSTISPHRQQQLFDIFNIIVKDGGEKAARELLLAHPREKGAFDAYVKALELIHRTVLLKKNTEKQNRFFSIMLLKWMQGIPIPELIDDRVRYRKSSSIGTNIRETLNLVETELRFNYVRAFGCYAGVLAHAFSVSNLGELSKSIPSIPLYLEVGASDKTMISFIAMGFSRMTAKRLNSLCPLKSLGVVDARHWLARQDLEIFGFAPHIRREIEFALQAQIIADN